MSRRRIDNIKVAVARGVIWFSIETWWNKLKTFPFFWPLLFWCNPLAWLWHFVRLVLYIYIYMCVCSAFVTRERDRQINIQSDIHRASSSTTHFPLHRVPSFFALYSSNQMQVAQYSGSRCCTSHFTLFLFLFYLITQHHRLAVYIYSRRVYTNNSAVVLNWLYKAIFGMFRYVCTEKGRGRMNSH